MTISRRAFVASMLATLLPRFTRAQLESSSRVFKNDNLRLHNDTRIGAMCAYHPSIYPDQAVEIDSRIVMANGPAKVTIQRSDYPGQTMDAFAEAAKIDCPVKLVWPGHDLMQPAEYARLREILNNRSWPTLFEHFPDADHGFSYRLERRENARANEISWPLTLSFFENSLA